MVGGPAGADDDTLEGTYRVTAFRSCVQARNISDGTFEIPVGSPPGTIRTGSISGVFEYYGDGTGTVEMEVFQIRGTTGTLVSKSRTTCDVENVVVNDDGSFSQDLVNCGGFVEQGASAGLTFVITPTSHRGQVTSNEKVLNLATVDPNVRTITFARPDGSGFSRDRICTFSGTSLEVKD